MHADDEDRHVPTGDGPAEAAGVAGGRSASTAGGGTGDVATGDAGVDEALGRLDELDGLGVRDHVRVFDAIHAALQDRLADVED